MTAPRVLPLSLTLSAAPANWPWQMRTGRPDAPARLSGRTNTVQHFCGMRGAVARMGWGCTGWVASQAERDPWRYPDTWFTITVYRCTTPIRFSSYDNIPAALGHPTQRFQSDMIEHRV